jgi:hypothetical protein
MRCSTDVRPTAYYCTGVLIEKSCLYRAGIHKACLYKKTDLKVNSFQKLFIDVFIGVYPTFYRTDLSTIQLVDFLWGWGHPLQNFQQIQTHRNQV